MTSPDLQDIAVGGIEHWTTPQSVECRSGSDQRRIGGLAAAFGRRSQLIPNGPTSGFYEQIDDQFFTPSSRQGWSNVVCRAEHDSRMLLGTVHSGTLQLALDRRGLDYECSLPASRQDVFESVGRGDYAGSSFQFQCISDDWSYQGGTPLRTLRSGNLHEVGPVTVPAYRDTSVALRSLARCMDAPLEDVEMYSRSGELRRFFARSDQPQQRSNDQPREAPMSYRPQWEIQRHHMMELDRLHRLKAKWDREAIAEIEDGSRRLRRAEALRINQRRKG
jgi:HK97 family phage prohead protease